MSGRAGRVASAPLYRGGLLAASHPLTGRSNLGEPKTRNTVILTPARAAMDDVTPPATNPGHSATPRLDTAVVFGSGREVILVHRGQEYRLRITKAGKLILTK
jgi:hemin uptake protein HemP